MVTDREKCQCCFLTGPIQNIFEDGELSPEATVKQYLTVQAEGSRQVRRSLEHYNLDAILAVGYRVRPQPESSSPRR